MTREKSSSLGFKILSLTFFFTMADVGEHAQGLFSFVLASGYHRSTRITARIHGLWIKIDSFDLILFTRFNATRLEVI